MERVIHTLDEMVRDGVIEDYVIGGATALLYFSVPNFVTEDIDVFVHLKDRPSSSIIDVSPLYNYLISRKNAHIQGEYIVVDDFPLQFLTPYDELSNEAFANAMSVSPENIPFKIFKLEYNMGHHDSARQREIRRAFAHIDEAFAVQQRKARVSA